jgi:exopolysaccharide production protein ExoY
MLERTAPVERSPANRSTTRTGVSGRRTGAHREEITFESHSVKLVGTADVRFSTRVSRPWSLAAKRAFDLVASLLGLILVAPVLAVLAALICLESPGPPLFRHERVGLGGRRFGCLKLRTMRTDAEEQLRANPALYDEYRRHHFKIPDDRDPRTTRIGRWLRRTSLDELPQLWNVLVGDMSLVGPRPVVAEELDVYQGSRTLLLSMRPGITGAWAVSGRNCVGYPERCELELNYVREWNAWIDARILVATVGTVLGRTPSRPVRSTPRAAASRPQARG